MGRVLVATIASIAGSLAADAFLIVIGQAVFPGTGGYAHFQFADYAKPPVTAVSIAGTARPIATCMPGGRAAHRTHRITSGPRGAGR
jgi:hypothetical protein